MSEKKIPETTAPAGKPAKATQKDAGISTDGKPVKSSNAELDQEELERITGGVIQGGWNRVRN
jgi:hypothetical protein